MADTLGQNICAIRTFGNGFGQDGAKRVIKNQALPHEPIVMTAEYAAELDAKNIPHIEIGTEITHDWRTSECRHCGCLYRKD